MPTLIVEDQVKLIMSLSDKPNQVGAKLQVGPQLQILTPNSDTPYALATLDLKSGGPMVIEMPPGNFIGLVDDHNMRWVYS